MSVEIAVPDHGTVAASLQSDVAMKITSDKGLLHNGQLYSLEASYGLHNGRWYPVSGLVLSGGASSTKAPARVQNPVLEALTIAVNAYIAAHPELIAEALARRTAQKIASLRSSREYAERQRARHQEELDRIDAEIAALEARP